VSRFNEVASVFMRCDHVASVIVNANHGIMWTATMLRESIALRNGVRSLTWLSMKLLWSSEI